MKIISRLFAVGVFLSLATSCSTSTLQQPDSNLPKVSSENQEDSNSSTSDENALSTDLKIETFVTDLEVPWDMVFTSDSRMLLTERAGRVRVVENGVLKPEPLYTFSNVSSDGEEGLMSMALDPDYQKNQWIYFSWAYQKGDGMAVKVSRFKDVGDQLENEFALIEDLAASRYHAGSRIAFGPDGKLYVTVGDGFERENAQKLEVLAGKILRINKDGSIPKDNPFPDSPVWSYGHRNAQGIAWHPETGELYETEHGPSVIDGPSGGDEVNHIIKGANYGWPLVSHDKTQEGLTPPLITFTPAEPPGSLMIYSGKLFPQFKNHLFFGSLRGEGLIHLVLDEANPDKISSWEKMKEVNFGRIRNVMEGPDGSIYFSTSNRDGRGSSQKGDDKIFRIMPGSQE